MRQFLKGKRLIALCEQKSASVQRLMVRLNAERRQLLERIRQCEEEIAALESILKTLQFNDTSVTRADIYSQIKQQALILHQRQGVDFERTNFQENVAEIDNEIVMCQKHLAILQRKEMKFTKWMRQGKLAWTMHQESVNEDEKLDLFPWVGK